MKLHKPFLIFLLLVALCAVVYAPSLKNGFIWDDDQYVYKNKAVQMDKQGLKFIWFSYAMPQYYPIVFSSFWIEHKLWGLNPFGYHLVNLLLHIINTLLLFCLVKKLSPRLALLTALLFAVHPIQVETVAWVTERKNLLALLFFLLSTLSYLSFYSNRKKRLYLLTMLFFVFALLSKSISVCFAAVPIIYIWWKKGKISLRNTLHSIPLLSIGLTAAVNTIYLELHRVGAQGYEWNLSFLDRFVLSGRILIFYIYKLLNPFSTFVFIYPRWPVDSGIWWQWIFPLISLTILFSFFYFRRRAGRGAFSLFSFYIISIFPALGYLNVYPMRFSFVADHFSYLSTPCLFLLLCATADTLFKKLKEKLPLLGSKTAATSIKAAFSILIVLLCIKNLNLIPAYKSPASLWNDVIKKNPDAWIAYNNLGVIYKEQEMHKESIPLYKKAIKLKDDYTEAYNNLGVAYTALKDYTKAIPLYQKTIELDPKFPYTYNNLAEIYKSLGRIQEAIPLYKKAIELRPDYAEAFNNMGESYYKLKRYKEAIPLYEKAININPEFAFAYNNLAVAFKATGKINEAILSFNKAIAINPGYPEAYYNLANTYLLINQPEKAVPLYNKAIEINPGLTEAYYNLGNVFSILENNEKAILMYNKTIELNPDQPEAYYNVANAYSALGKYKESIPLFKKAIELKSGYLEAYNNLAIAYNATGDSKESINIYKQIIKVKPDNAVAHMNLALIYINLKQYEQASPYYAKAIELGYESKPELEKLLAPYR
ncbi:MAG: tetratricopeptide repeat protein [Candidatus Omnitrophota bacterium]